MNLYIFIIFVVRPAGTRNPPEIRGCGCGCKNAPAGLLADGFFPIPRICLRAGFLQTRTRTRGCHPYGSAPFREEKGERKQHCQTKIVWGVFLCKNAKGFIRKSQHSNDDSRHQFDKLWFLRSTIKSTKISTVSIYNPTYILLRMDINWLGRHPSRSVTQTAARVFLSKDNLLLVPSPCPL